VRCRLLGLAAAAFAALLAFAPAGAAADVSVRVRLETPQVRVGQSVDLAVQIDGAQDVPAPDLGDAEGLRVRYVGPSTQLSIVHGRTSASVTHHFAVTPTRPGRYAIGPVRVEHRGRTYDGGTVRLEAFAGAAPPAGPPGAAAGGEPIRLVLSAARSTVYLHERLPLTIELRVGNVRVADVQYPALAGDGFALDKLVETGQRRERTPRGPVQVIGLRTVLTPLRSGPLTVGPARMELSVLSSRGRDPFGDDPFFERFFGGTRRPMTLESEPLVLTVLPLPDEGRPADFSGAVGRFELEVEIAPREVQVGDPVTVTTTVRGTGNLEHVAPPALPAIDALRLYPVQETAPADQPADGSERRVFEQVAIPQRAGPLTLPEIRFSYFDPEAGAYRTLTRPPVTLAVRAPAEPRRPPQVVGGAPAVARPEQLGRDIVFIKDVPGALAPAGARRHRSALFWAWQPLPLLAWLAAVVYDRRRRRLHDAGWVRFTRAGREARRALAAARRALGAGNQAAFYDTIARAVSEYVCAKLDLPPGALTADTVAERLHGRPVAPAAVDDLRELLAACERVRFAPAAAADGDMRRTLERAAAIVRALERERRLAPPAAAAIAAAALGFAAALGAAADSPAPRPSGPPPLLAPGPAAGGLAAAPEGGESPSAVFFRANGLYSDERYTEAAVEYERILAAGRASGNLYFNLGNARFKAGDLGGAVVAYERARLSMPGDPDLRANLAYARTLAGDAG
jgi:tetratricopeptide (TPR) repeat protein